MRNFLALQLLSTTFSYTKSGYYEYDMSQTEVLEVPLKYINTTFIIHDNVTTYSVDLFDANQVFLGTFGAKTQTFVTLTNKTGTIFIKKSGDLPKIHFSLIIPDNNQKMLRCKLFVLSTISTDTFEIDKNVQRSYSNFTIFNNNNICFIFTSPNVQSYEITGSTEQIDKIIDTNQLKLIMVTEPDSTFSVSIKPVASTTQTDAISYRTDFIYSSSVFVENRLHVINLVSGVYDFMSTMLNYEKVLIYCPTYTVIHFHTFPGTIEILSQSQSYGYISAEKPAFAFGPEYGRIIVRNAEHEYISFSAIVHNDIECESVLLYSDFTNNLIKINKTTYDMCIFVSTKEPINIEGPVNVSFDVYVGRNSSQTVETLKFNQINSILMHYKTTMAKEASIKLQTSGQTSNFWCRFADTLKPFLLMAGDLRDSNHPLVISATSISQRILELKKGQNFIINIKSPMAALIHDDTYVTKTAVVDGESFKFTGLFDFGTKTGQIICNQTSPDETFNVLVTIFPNTYSKIHITTKGENYNLINPLYSPFEELIIGSQEKILYIYSSMDVRTIQASFNIGWEMDYLYILSQGSRTYSYSDSLTVTTNFFAFALHTSFQTEAKFVKVEFDQKTTDPFQYDMTLRSNGNAREITPNERYKESLISLTVNSFSDVKVYSNSLPIMVDLRGKNIFCVVHNRNYSAGAYLGATNEMIGTFSPANNTYGVYLPSAGRVSISCPTSIVYFTVAYNKNLNNVMCDKLALSNVYYYKFFASKESIDKDGSRNITMKPNQNICYFFLSPYFTQLEIDTKLSGPDYITAYTPAKDRVQLYTAVKRTGGLDMVKSVMFISSIQSQNSEKWVINGYSDTYNDDILLNYTATILPPQGPAILYNSYAPLEKDDKSFVLMLSTILLIIFITIVIIMLIYCGVMHYVRRRIDRELNGDQGQTPLNGNLAPPRPDPTSAADNQQHSDSLDDLDNENPQDDGTEHPYMMDQHTVAASNPYLKQSLINQD